MFTAMSAFGPNRGIFTYQASNALEIGASMEAIEDDFFQFGSLEGMR
jgi:hypothetical protein